MLQRIQTVYLLLVVLASGVLPFFVDIYSVNGESVTVMTEVLYLVAYELIAVLALIAIFLFKNRKNQFVVNRLNMIFNLILLGVFVYRSLTLSGESEISEKGIGMFLPIISIVFLVLANRAIKKDEDLVKSVDRLR
ncbi:protein of unknown function [Pustulibacterium marinum]|uniref:Transcription termination factor Rho n=1 Tax=Pustulibacterium marinum TaxID=1224947 RepID=A0A1I7FDJ0_9FLAO|nr:DUF4293 domain-containing protein [Pustulibacterium marinum]SFU34303.1 protein of unknown function [Pustulibacterium marinum]